MQEIFVDPGDAVLHQCIRPLIGACAPGHHGYQRACDLISGQASNGLLGVTSVRTRREDRSSIVVSSSRRPRRVNLAKLRHRQSPCFAPFLCSRLLAVPSSRPAGVLTRRAQGPSRLGRRARLAFCSSLPRPRLDGPEHGARIKQVGAHWS